MYKLRFDVVADGFDTIEQFITHTLAAHDQVQTVDTGLRPNGNFMLELQTTNLIAMHTLVLEWCGGDQQESLYHMTLVRYYDEADHRRSALNDILEACSTIDEALSECDEDPGCVDQLGSISHLAHAIRKEVASYKESL